MTTPSGPGTPEVSGYENTRGGAESTSKVQQAANTASDEASRVADVAKEQAKDVASEVSTQARDLVGELKTQVRDQSLSQRDRVSGTLRQFGDDLDEMNRSTASSGLASDLASQAASKAREFSAFLDGHEPGDLIEEIRAFARRRPGAFLLGAAVAGVIAGRLTRGAVASNSSDTAAGAGRGYQTSRPAPGTTPASVAAESRTGGRMTGNGPTEPADPAVSSVGSSGLLPPDETLVPGQGRP